MVRYSTLDRTFSALSDPTRRQILERLARGPATISELRQPFDISLPGLLKHVRILQEAHIVITEKQGRTRQCRLGPEHLDDAARWIQT
jgi:DNA-binding transcriptional ArsR family regulator